MGGKREVEKGKHNKEKMLEEPQLFIHGNQKSSNVLVRAKISKLIAEMDQIASVICCHLLGPKFNCSAYYLLLTSQIDEYHENAQVFSISISNDFKGSLALPCSHKHLG